MFRILFVFYITSLHYHGVDTISLLGDHEGGATTTTMSDNPMHNGYVKNPQEGCEDLETRTTRSNAIVDDTDGEPYQEIYKVWDMTDEMLFHWLGFGAFRTMDLSEQRKIWFVRFNPFYWILWFGTIVSLFVGRRFHSIFGQGGIVHPNEARIEYEARVHWIYCSSGGMLCVFMKNILYLIYFAMIEVFTTRFFLTYVLPLIIGSAMAVAFAFGNASFLQAMKKKNRSGVRSVIMCNVVFSLGLSICFVVITAEHGQTSSHENKYFNEKTLYEKAYFIGSYFVKCCCLFFYLLATCLYGRLWSFYEASTNTLSGKILEALPSFISASIMTGLVFIGFTDHEFRQYIYATFV